MFRLLRFLSVSERASERASERERERERERKRERAYRVEGVLKDVWIVH